MTGKESGMASGGESLDKVCAIILCPVARAEVRGEGSGVSTKRKARMDRGKARIIVRT